MKIAIIGAGPAGLSCAAKLSENNITDIDIYEESDFVGGMSKSFVLWDQIVDLGPHRFFSMDKRINDFWLDIAGDDYLLVDRLTRIYYGKKFYLYPVQAMDALKKMGFFEAMGCAMSYFAALFKKKGDEKNFEEWVVSPIWKEVIFNVFQVIQ